MKTQMSGKAPVFDMEENRFFLERPRIHRLLEKAVESPVVVICAGEGCGKTYAVSSFLRTRSEAAAWIQHSDRDNQPLRFWENYARSIGLCMPEAKHALRKISFPETAEQISKWHEINRKYLGQNKYIVVGDDFHRINSKAVLDFIDRGISSPVPNHTLILICRSEPAINTLSLLSKGRLARIGAEELLFTREEIAEYFRLWDMDLSEEEIDALHRDTEGWPLALGLLATEMRKKSVPYSKSLLEKGIFRILEDDLFASAPKELQRFLIKLSFFEQWPLELLKKISVVLPEQYRGGPEGNCSPLFAELGKLSALIRHSYYLQGYRIHQVFLDYLREKQKEIPPDEIKAVSILAAQWCLENNLKMDAAINFERAGDCAGIVSIVNTFPRVLPKAAASLFLEIVERLMLREDLDKTDFHFLLLRYATRGRLLMCLSRFEEATEVFRKSIQRFENEPPTPLNSMILTRCWSFRGSLALMRRRLDSSENYAVCFEKAGFYYKRHPFPLPKGMTLWNIGSYVSQVSHPAEAGEFDRRINTFAEGQPRTIAFLNGSLLGVEDLARTELAYYQAELDKAEQYARRTVIKAREKNQWEIENRALFLLMRIVLHRGSAAELLELQKQGDALLSAADYYNRNTNHDIINGWIYTQLGAGEKAASWLKDKFEESELYSVYRNFESLVKAKFLFSEERYEETINFLSLKENKEGLGSFLLGMLDMNCLEAAARFRLGDEKTALTLLETTYQAAASNSLWVSFIELGQDMRLLAAAAISAGSAIPRQHLEELRSRASAYGKNLFAIAEQIREREDPGEKIYLTRQERAVLKGLSRGQNREEIAAGAGLSLGAVKNVISRACEKLGAVNSADAVRIALSKNLSFL